MKSPLGEFLKTTVGVGKGFLPSPILFNLFPEKITQETLHDHHTSVSNGGRSICKIGFASDIDLMGGSNGELQDLTNRPVDRALAYEMEVNTEKSMIMTNSMNTISGNISMKSQTLEEVTTQLKPAAKPD